MYICYVCNGLEKLKQSCPVCEKQMIDGGRATDYHGDYAPYIEQEGAQLIDGIAHSADNHQCMHIVFCPTCERTKEILIMEQKYNHSF